MPKTTPPAAAFEQTVARQLQRLTKPEATLHLAVSGGRDSVALTLAARRSCLRLKDARGAHGLRIIHVDHQLRSTSSADAEFVQSLASDLDLACDVVRVDIPTTGSAASEDAARRARYDAISEAVLRNAGDTVAMAHTADDQAETVLHRIVRGTGLTGLAGIPEQRPLSTGVTIVRPMLSVTRKEVTEYLVSLHRSWQDDPTNDQTDYTRNLIRNTLLPTLRDELNPQVDSALCRLAASARETSELIQQIVDARIKDLPLPTNDIPLSLFDNCPSQLIVECLRTIWHRNLWPEQAMTRSHWQLLVELVTTNKSNRQLHLPGLIIKRTRTHLERIDR